MKTLIYADIFDYPLKAWEIHKWLISAKKCELPAVEIGLRKLIRRGVVIEKGGYYALSGRVRIFKKREERITPSQKFLHEAKIICSLFRVIPWIKLVGISGNLAMENASEEDDIDLFVITEKNRLWISRLLILFILALLEKRRTKRDSRKKAAGKFCLNLLLEKDQLSQNNKDLYISHEVLQMKPLWERENTYGLFLEANEWVFGFLANWLSTPFNGDRVVLRGNRGVRILDGIESFVRFFQLRYMGIPKKAEQVSLHSVYFHPEDNRERVLKEYEKRCRKYL